MRGRARWSLRAAALTVAAALLLPGGAYAEETQPVEPKHVDPVAAGFDAVVIRPLGLVTLVLGAIFFVPVAVVTAPGGKHALEEALGILVTDPAQNVFQRPLGDF